MGEQISGLVIEKIAGLGDGIAMREGRKVFVPYTMKGDIVRARIVRKTPDADFTRLDEIMTPSPRRQPPACRHFAGCGGCALQHLPQEEYTAFKQTMADEAVRKAGYDPAIAAPVSVLPAASRRRVELKVEGSSLGYYAERSHQLVDISECKVLEPALETLVLTLKTRLADLPAATSIQINGAHEGYDVLIGQSADNAYTLKDIPSVQRLSRRCKNTICTVFVHGPVTQILGTVTVNLPPGAFLQASIASQAIITEYVVQSVSGAKRILDLFAGIGTYSFPLSSQAEVTAVEGEGAMVAAMHDAATHAKLRGFKTQQRDLFTKPVLAVDAKKFDAAVINPPRAGAAAQVKELATAKVPKIVMVSCNPATFTRDAKTLREAGYTLKRVLPIDQFVYSAHLELVADFEIIL